MIESITLRPGICYTVSGNGLHLNSLIRLRAQAQFVPACRF